MIHNKEKMQSIQISESALVVRYTSCEISILQNEESKLNEIQPIYIYACIPQFLVRKEIGDFFQSRKWKSNAI